MREESFFFTSTDMYLTPELLECLSGKKIHSSKGNISAAFLEVVDSIQLEIVRIEGSGENALDFHIAYIIGKNSHDQDVGHIILSKDKGFDPLIAYLRKNGIMAGRLGGITTNKITKTTDNKNQPTEKTTKKTSQNKRKPTENTYRLEGILSKIEKIRRPKTIKTLTSHIKAQIKCDDEQAQKEAQVLLKRQFISLSGEGESARITYKD